MGFLRKAFVFSVFVLLASIFISRHVVSRIDDEQKIKCFNWLLAAVMKIDAALQCVHIRGFHRLFESGSSYMVFYMADTTGLNVEQQLFNGVEVLIFDPIKRAENRAAIVHFHGSGWVYFNPKSFATYIAEIARRTNTMIVSVNYRKAPENPFPAGVNDAITATKYFIENCGKFGVDPNRIALMGESAGGNLVMAVAHHLSANRNNLPLPRIVIPLNPSLQMVDMNTPSFREDRDTMLKKHFFSRVVCAYAFGALSTDQINDCIDAISNNAHLTAAALERVKNNVDWTQYLSGPRYDGVSKSSFTAAANAWTERLSQLVMDPLFSPLSAMSDTELQALPPVYLFSAARDPLRDDASIMAARLAKVGRLGALHEFDHNHGEFVMTGVGSAESRNAFRKLIAIIGDSQIL